jgi:hypothetical protein
MPEEPFNFTPPHQRTYCAFDPVLFELLTIRGKRSGLFVSFQPKETVALLEADQQRQKAVFGRFALTDLTASCPGALKGAERHFALECFAKTRIGFVAFERT